MNFPYHCCISQNIPSLKSPFPFVTLQFGNLENTWGFSRPFPYSLDIGSVVSIDKRFSQAFSTPTKLSYFKALLPSIQQQEVDLGKQILWHCLLEIIYKNVIRVDKNSPSSHYTASGSLLIFCQARKSSIEVHRTIRKKVSTDIQGRRHSALEHEWERCR